MTVHVGRGRALRVLASFGVQPGQRARRHRVLRGLSGGGPGLRSRLRELAGGVRATPTRGVTTGVAVGTGLAGAALGGPVAGLAAVVYAGLALRGWRRSRARRAATAEWAAAVDALGALAADLRAGLPPPAAWSAVAGALPAAAGRRPAGHAEPAGYSEVVRRLAERAGAARRLADRTGAPLAELLERIESDARAASRVRSVATAQAAGARATALLLLVLPAGGIGLGYGIGADPLAVLLGTPLGAGCLAVSLCLQVGGVCWADRLSGVRL